MSYIELDEAQTPDTSQPLELMLVRDLDSLLHESYSGVVSLYASFLATERYLTLRSQYLLIRYSLMTPEACFDAAWRVPASCTWKSVCRATKTLWRSVFGRP